MPALIRNNPSSRCYILSFLGALYARAFALSLFLKTADRETTQAQRGDRP